MKIKDDVNVLLATMINIRHKNFDKDTVIKEIVHIDNKTCKRESLKRGFRYGKFATLR